MLHFIKKNINVICLFFVITGSIQADPLFLTLPLEGKSLSTGYAQTALGTGTTALRSNPAGLAFSPGAEFSLNHMMLGEDFSGDSILFAYPFTPLFSVGVQGTVLYLNDSFERVEDFQSTGQSLTMSDMELGVSTAYQFMPNVSAGVTMKYFRMQLGPQISQNFSSDLGVNYRFAVPFTKRKVPEMAFGASVRNLGPAFDFYGGGVKEPQPTTYTTGLGWYGSKYAAVSFEYHYSQYEEGSMHMGLELLPQYMFSPKVGIIHDFSGLSFTAGGSVAYGEQFRIQALGGSTFGNSNQTGNLFFSMLIQNRTYHRGIDAGQGETLIEESGISIKKVSSMYTPSELLPFRSNYRAEKVQGFVLKTEKAQGFEQKEMRLKRIALQPEDEPYLEELIKSDNEKLFLKGRRMGIWLDLEKAENIDKISYWDIFSSVAEAKAPVNVLTGLNLTRLNNNPNAPLKVEWRLKIKIINESGLQEIRSELTELYSGSNVLARNFEDTGNLEQTWLEVADFYAEYFNSMEPFYLYQRSTLEARK